MSLEYKINRIISIGWYLLKVQSILDIHTDQIVKVLWWLYKDNAAMCITLRERYRGVNKARKQIVGKIFPDVPPLYLKIMR
jgi:hypothetical protein